MNIKVLTEKELSYLEGKYEITFNEDNNLLLVSMKAYNKITAHPLDKPLSLNIVGLRRIVFSLKMIRIWMELRKNNYDCSLFLVHQISSKLILTYQDVDYNTVRDMLDSKTIKIKNV